MSSGKKTRVDAPDQPRAIEANDVSPLPRKGDSEAREARPVSGTVDMKAMYVDIAKRFPLTIARLAK
jgi:hypothetical protein